jgi:ketol-acid reductoisomerase
MLVSWRTMDRPPLKIVRGSQHAPLDALQGKAIAVIGYGTQGSAHAQNLRESGLDVRVANRPDSPNGQLAASAGFEPLPIPEAVEGAALVILALPDEVHGNVYERELEPHLTHGTTIGVIHGYSIRFNSLQPRGDLGVVLVAPKGPGTTLRARFVEQQGLPSLLAVHQDNPQGNAEAIALAWANGIGSARAGIIYTTCADEAETDLFGEQAVLCGGMTWLIHAAFETLVQAGYPPELAYLECCHEVKQVADLVYQRGVAGMTKAISNTAEFGAYHAGPMLIDEHVRARMRAILEQIQNGEFATRMHNDHSNGFHWFEQQRKTIEKHAIESAGETIRDLMPWLAENT